MSVNRKSRPNSPKDDPSEETPELFLRKASVTKDPAARAKYATSGLSASELERDTQLLLLRQLCLSHLERGRPLDAKQIALQMVALGEWPEIAHQEVARASSALGDFQACVNHLRLAGRAAPAHRRGFHLWCLGSTLYATGQVTEALEALERAKRWSTKERSVTGALAELCRHAAGQPADLAGAFLALSESERRLGVTDWVAGELLFQLGKRELALPLLEEFLRRIEARPAAAAGLRAELAHVRRLISGCNRTNP